MVINNEVEVSEWREKIINQILAYYETGKYEEVIDCSLDLLKDDFEDWDGLFYISRSYLALERYDEANQSIRQFLTAYPDVPEGFMLMGELCSETGQYNEAISNFEQCISMDPEDGYYYYYLAKTIIWEVESSRSRRRFSYLKSSQSDSPRIMKAIDNVTIAIQYIPDDPDFYLCLAHCYDMLRKPEEAYEFISKTINLDPTSTNAHLLLASYHLNNGDLNTASSHCKQALMQEPNNNYAIELQDEINSFETDVKQYYLHRVQYWLRICKAYPTHAANWLQVIRIKLEYGKHKPIKELKKYLKLSPDDWDMQITYGKVLYDDKRYLSATQHFQMLNQANPVNPFVREWINTLSRVPWLKKYVHQYLSIMKRNVYLVLIYAFYAIVYIGLIINDLLKPIRKRKIS
nr:tetratricopeptide repeat protein [Lysinibacillus timonensis]